MGAENRPSTTEEALRARKVKNSTLIKMVTRLQAKVDDLENRGRKISLSEKAEGSTLFP